MYVRFNQRDGYDQFKSSAGNVSPYSSGLPGASLTSTSVDPQEHGAASKLLWDEVSLNLPLY